MENERLRTELRDCHGELRKVLQENLRLSEAAGIPAVRVLMTDLASESTAAQQVGLALFYWGWETDRTSLGRVDWPTVIGFFEQLGGTVEPDGQASHWRFTWHDGTVVRSRGMDAVRKKVDRALAMRGGNKE